MGFCKELSVILIDESKSLLFCTKLFYAPGTFKVANLGFDKSTISMNLVYFNPNSFGVDLKHVDCDVYVDHNYLGKYVLDTMMHISKRSEFALPSRMDVDMRNLFKNTFHALLSQDVLLEVNGNTRLGKAGIFVNVPFTYSGRHKLSFF